MGGTVIPVSSVLGWDTEAGDDEIKAMLDFIKILFF